MNNAFPARWSASPEVNSKYYSPPRSRSDKIARQEFNFLTIFWYVETNKLSFLICVWYTLKKLFTSVSMKVVDIYLHLDEKLLIIDSV